MEMDIMYSEAVRMAMEVDFLECDAEFVQYANALYAAMVWGEGHSAEKGTGAKSDGDIRHP